MAFFSFRLNICFLSVLLLAGRVAWFVPVAAVHQAGNPTLLATTDFTSVLTVVRFGTPHDAPKSEPFFIGAASGYADEFRSSGVFCNRADTCKRQLLSGPLPIRSPPADAI